MSLGLHRSCPPSSDNETKANATLAAIKGAVADPAKIKKIAGLDNAFVARSGELDVTFRVEGDSVYITSVIKKG